MQKHPEPIASHAYETHFIERYVGNGGTVSFKLCRKESPAAKRNFEFVFATPKDHRLIAYPREVNHSGPGDRDWFAPGVMSQMEKLHLFDAVLAYYREFSPDPDGMKIASLGVFKNPDPRATPDQKHFIFVRQNMTRDHRDIRKGNRHENQCAELGMLNTAHAFLPEEPLCEALYVKGGRTADPLRSGDKGVPIVAPCGACTDVFADQMKENARLYVIPATPAGQKLKINRDAEYLSDLGPDEVWDTTVQHLNRGRYLTDAAQGMTEEVKRMQRDGLTWVATQLVDYHPDDVSDDIADWARFNAKERRSSIATLDAATDKQGNLDTAQLNTYMLGELLDLLHPRMVEDLGPRPEIKQAKHWLNTVVQNVSLCVVRAENGCYSISIDSRTSPENSMVSAGRTVISAAVKNIGRQGITHVWTMALNPLNIAEGVLDTLSKREREMLYKRRPSGAPQQVCVLPFNDGTARRDVLERFTKDAREAYVSLFDGIRGTNTQELEGDVDNPPETPLTMLKRASRGNQGDKNGKKSNSVERG